MFSILSKGLLVYLFVGYLQVDGKRSQLVNFHKIFCHLPYTYINTIDTVSHIFNFFFQRKFTGKSYYPAGNNLRNKFELLLQLKLEFFCF